MALYKGFFPNWLRLGPWNIIVSFSSLVGVFGHTLYRFNRAHASMVGFHSSACVPSLRLQFFLTYEQLKKIDV